VISSEIGRYLDIKELIVDKSSLSSELNIPVIDVDRNKIKIRPLIEKLKAKIDGSIKKS
jgi:hypothetical protein